MTRNSPPTFSRLTPRTLELLQSLDVAPLTGEQLLRMSRAWNEPFTSESRIKRKLSELKKTGWVESFPYAIPGNGRPPHYWKLTRTGYALAFPERIIPKRRYFDAIGVAMHRHTRAVAEVLVHTIANASHEGLSLSEYSRENQLRLGSGRNCVYPDAAFRMRVGDRSPLFCLEIDNGTERVETAKDVESIERKIRVYDLYQSDMEAFDHRRPLVLLITTRGERRLQHIIDTVGRVVSNPNRSLVYATTLDTFLGSTNPVTDPVFWDHRFRQQSMVRFEPTRQLRITGQLLAPALQAC